MARFGTLDTQYLDDVGNPLVNGKIAFKESGTNDDKNTYADINETIANANPLILDADGRQPNCFFSGSAKAILFTAADVQVRPPLDPVTASDSGAGGVDPFGSWNSLSIYSKGDIVTGSDGLYYKCIVVSSQGDDPTTTAASWSAFQFLGLWNINQTYNQDDIVQGSDGYLYNSIAGANIGNDPVSDSASTDWEPALFSATETRSGISERATDAETNTGTATDKTITPANLAQYTGFPSDNLNTQTFTSSGTWTKPAVDHVYYILVGGGAGGGGANASNNGGGGGGGSVEYGWVAVTDDITVTIGAGGAGNSGASGSDGSSSTFTVGAAVTSLGGQGGNAVSDGAGNAGGNVGAGAGGGGGGAGSNGGNATSAASTLAQSTSGTIGGGSSSAATRAGGGGAGLLGFGGGGGGGSAVNFGLGNSGGGSGGAGVAGVAGTANTGGGGGGSGENGSGDLAGGAGGSGVCIIYWWT